MFGVDQRDASAGNDLIGRDKYETNNYYSNAAPVLQQLMQKLADEMKDDVQRKTWCESLQYFNEKFSVDGVIGLDQKLTKAGRDSDKIIAFKQKELFVKLLDKYSLYESAQEILAFCLHRIQHEFDTYVTPKVDKLSKDQIDALISERVVYPVIQDCGVGVFNLNHGVVMGMIYWLAEQCFVRWHK